MISIKYGDLIQALENKSPELNWYLDAQTGKMILHSEDIDLGDDGAFADQLDWFPDRYLKIEPIPPKESYRFMIDFTNEVKETQAKVDIAQTFSQKRPVKQFLSTVARYPKVNQQWIKFNAGRHADFVIKQLNEAGIEAEVTGLP